VEHAYERLLGWCLRHRWIVVTVSVAILVWGWFLLTGSRLEFVVDDDMSEFEVVAEAPPGSSLERTAEIIAGMEETIRGIPEVVTLFATAGVRGQFQSNVSDISIYIGLKHLSERTRSQEAIKQDVRRRLAVFPGTRVSVQQISLIGGGGFRQTPFNLILRGPDLTRLEQYARGVVKELSGRPGFVDTDTAQAYRQPEVQVQIDRHKAADLGVRVDTVASALRTMVGGEKVGFYRELGEQYDVRLRLREDFRARPDTLSQLYVPARDGLMGVVKKNAILQVDYTNVLRARGLPRHEAQMQADRARLRPILMTTLAIIAGMLPVALGRGDGAASRASLALVVVGGQALCLVVTLVVTPVIYSMFDDVSGLRAFARLRFPRLRRRRPGWLAREDLGPLRPSDSPARH
jgi:multidrug efflux pump subunit AcrB